MSVAHYECPITGEIHPVDEMQKVRVYEVNKRVSGLDPLGAVYIHEGATHKQYVSFSLIGDFGQPLVLEKAAVSHGQKFNLQNMDEDEYEGWKRVFQAAKQADV